ncbi:MAG TPA: class I SAM-dependent methyltransferase [Herpetosiphonaceae bacterium]
MTHPWMLDEVALAGAEHLDPAYIRGYDAKAGQDPAAEIALLRHHGLTPEATVVDLGAGTGTFALAAAPVCRQVIAVDVSAPMLAALAQRARAQGITTITTVRAGFVSYDHQGPPADVVYTRHALHHLPDPWKAVALARIAALLRPGGLLYLRDLIFSCEPEALGGVIEAWLAGAATDPALGWTRAELETHLRTEHSTFSWLLEAMLARVGFELVAVEHAPSQIYSTYLAVKRAPGEVAGERRD